MKRQDIQDLLRDHADGKLSADDATFLQEQINSDPGLARFTEFADWAETRLAQLAAAHLDAHLDAHPSGQELVTAALGPLTEISADSKAEVLLHIAQCAECQELVTAVRTADAEMTDKANSRPRRKPAWQKMALAAVFALAAVGAGVLLGPRSQSPRPAPIRLAAVTRSTTAEPAIVALPNNHIPPLLLTLDPWIGRANADNYTLQVGLFATDEPSRALPTLSIDAQDWQADTGGIVVVWAQSDLPRGHYRIEVRDDENRVIYQSLFELFPPAE